jgi:DnaJ-class molecular chaperone
MTTAELIRSQIKQVSQEPCACVICPDCKGSGNIRVEDPMNMPFDDLEPCDYCHGGISETCDRCQLLNDLDYQLEDAAVGEQEENTQ